MSKKTFFGKRVGTEQQTATTYQTKPSLNQLYKPDILLGLGGLESDIVCVLSNSTMVDRRNGVEELGRFGHEFFRVSLFHLLANTPAYGDKVKEWFAKTRPDYWIGKDSLKKYNGSLTQEQINELISKTQSPEDLPLDVVPFLISSNNLRQGLRKDAPYAFFPHLIRDASRAVLKELREKGLVEETNLVQAAKTKYGSTGGGYYEIQGIPYKFERRQARKDLRLHRRFKTEELTGLDEMLNLVNGIGHMKGARTNLDRIKAYEFLERITGQDYNEQISEQLSLAKREFETLPEPVRDKEVLIRIQKYDSAYTSGDRK